MQLKKLLAAAAIGAAFIVGSLATTPALAQHYHGGYGGYHGGYAGYHGGYYGGWHGGWGGPRVGFYFGPGYYPGDYWGYPGYYAGFYPWGYAAAVDYGYSAPAPSQYIEQNQAPAASYSWYRCDSANGAYYPYVKECAGGWTKVAPSAPQQ
jgi:hypothetical protein